MAAQSMALAAMDVCATPGGDLRTLCFPVVGGENPTTVFCTCRRRQQGGRSEGARNPSFVHYACKTPRCGCEWESDWSQNRGSLNLGGCGMDEMKRGERENVCKA